MVAVISYMYRSVENYVCFLFAYRGTKCQLPQTSRRVALFSSSCKLGFVYDLKGGAECELLTFSLIWLQKMEFIGLRLFK